jgi:hypothetical protein
MKKITTILLTVCFTFFLIVQTTNIQGQTWPPAGMQGDGTSESPWQITTAEHLAALAAYVNVGNGDATAFKQYKLMNDINLGSYSNWTPIGNSGTTSTGQFQGFLDGNNKVVQNLTISSSSNYRGLFGYTANAGIKNLGVVNCNIVGGSNVGALVGQNNFTYILNCYATGSVGGSNSIYTGGLIGFQWSSLISNCYATCSVNGKNHIGGLVGASNSGTISYCYATGNVSATEDYVGGLVGRIVSNASIRNCVAANQTVSTTSNATNISRVCGSIVGTTQKNYALGSMTVQNNNGNITIVDGSNVAGTAQTLAILQTFSFYATFDNWHNDAWDIIEPTSVWKICNVEGLPFMRWQNTVCPPTLPSITTTTLPDGEIEISYSQCLSATGSMPITWSIESGSLPNALSLSGDVISGTPSAGGTFVFTVKATNSVGSDTKQLSISIAKLTQTAPGAPTKLSQTATSITLNTVSGCEYSINNGNSYQTSPTFSGLTPNISYTFIQRKEETPTLQPSPPSPSASFSTDKATLTGTPTISGSAVFGETLSVVTTSLTSVPVVTLGALGYQWRRGTNNITGATNSTYKLVQADIGSTITVTVTAANCTGEAISPPTTIVAKALQTEPVAPTLADKTATTITLKVVSGCEYNINGGNYQESPLFSGLMPNTPYTFTQRKVETDTHLASPASPTATFTTDETQGNTYTITASVNNSNWGTITPSGACVVEEGKSITFNIVPTVIGEIEDVKVNGTGKGAISTFTFENVTANGTIEAIFKEYVGINENVFGNINVYPNPTTGELRIESGGLRMNYVEIFDISGRTLLTQKPPISPKTVINISHLTAGLYFLKISSEAGEVIKKVLKE